MKKLSKLFSVLMALTMVLALAIPAFASNNGDGDENGEQTTASGSIVIDNPTAGVTYTAYKLFDVVQNTEKTGEGDAQKIVVTGYTYSTTNQQVISTLQSEGINLKLTAASDGSYVVTTQQATSNNDGTMDGNEYVFVKSTTSTNSEGNTVNDTMTAAELATALANKISSATGTDTPLGTAAGSMKAETTDPDTGKTTYPDEITISNLDNGYYFVYSDSAKALCLLDTVPGSDGGASVTITNKDSEPTADKQVEEKSTGSWGSSNDAGIGDTVNFRTKVTIPAGTTALTLHDVMDKDQLKITSDTNGNPTITGVYKNKVTTTNNADGSTTEKDEPDEENGALTKDTDYKVSAGTETGEGATPCTFEVEFTSDFLASAKTEEVIVWVEYSATVQSGALIATANPNETHLSYTNSNGVSSTTEDVPDITNTYVWSFDLNKVDGTTTTETSLPGAQFVLYKKDGETKKYAVLEDVTETDTENNNATITYKRLKEWTENDKDSTETTKASVITTGDSKISIKGLDAGTYYLHETKAPDGYNLLTADVEFEIYGTAKDGTSVGDGGSTIQKGTINVTTTSVGVQGETAKAENNSNVVTVQNKSGTELPSTGGMGTTLFYVVGGVLVIGAGVALITKKRMSSKG